MHILPFWNGVADQAIDQVMVHYNELQEGLSRQAHR